MFRPSNQSNDTNLVLVSNVQDLVKYTVKVGRLIITYVLMHGR